MSERRRPARRIESISALPAIGSRVQLCLSPGRQHAVFDGIVAKHLAAIGPDQEHLRVEVQDSLTSRLGASIAGRWELQGSAAIHIPTGRCVFNSQQDGLASPGTYAVGSLETRVFDAGEDGQLWSVANILGYLIAAHAPTDLDITGLSDVQDIAEDIYPSRLSLAGLTIGQAIARVCGLAGLAVRGSLSNGLGGVRSSLVIYRPGHTGRRRPVKLQRHGAALDRRRTDLWKGQVNFSRRPCRRNVLVLGAKKVYESTFELQPCWDSTQATYHYRDFIRSEAQDWPPVADIYRKWALNEAGDYSDAPLNLDAFDFATISSDDFLLNRSRRFLPCLSRGPDDQSLGVVVEVSYDDGSTWQRYGGAVRISGHEGAIRLTDDALPADYFEAVRAGTAKFHVTAAVTADRRLSVEGPGDVGARVEVVDFPAGRWSQVHTSSIFYGDDSLPAPDELDDTDRLAAMAENLSQADAETVEASFALGRADPTFAIGDIVPRIDGRGLELAVFPGAAPHIRRIEHRFGEEWSTHLTVSG